MSVAESPHFPGGNLKTAAKLLVLEWYLDEYVKIMNKQWYDDIWYVDTHAGTGKTLCTNGVHIDGSTLRVIRRYGDDFDKFYFYEVDHSSFNTLHETLSNSLDLTFDVSTARIPGEDFLVARCDDPYVRIMNLDSNEGVSKLASDLAGGDSHWFTFIDPGGLQADKETLDTLIERGNMDILINYQTTGARRNAAEGAIHAHGSVDRTMGSGGWPLGASEEDLVSLYKERLEEHDEWSVRSKDMTDPNDPTHRFDLVFASAYEVAHRIMNHIMNERNDLWSEAAKELGETGLGRWI